MRDVKTNDFKAVLFDKDGVLIDSINTCFDAINGTLRHYGIPEITRDYYIRKLWGMKSWTIFEDSASLTTAEVGERIEYYNKLRDKFDDKTKAFPHVTEVLRSLKESRKIKIGLVTNTKRSTAIKILEGYSWASYFDVVVGGDDVEPKPSPKPILLACEKLGTLPEETLFVGDTNADINASKSAGCMTAIVASSMSFEELSTKEGIIPIRDLREVLRLVRRAQHAISGD
jgi:HAD superfamily hydrolase (TIGR01549 family)